MANLSESDRSKLESAEMVNEGDSWIEAAWASDDIEVAENFGTRYEEISHVSRESSDRLGGDIRYVRLSGLQSEYERI